jgi:ABC-2 type transport system permease protein
VGGQRVAETGGNLGVIEYTQNQGAEPSLVGFSRFAGYDGAMAVLPIAANAFRESIRQPVHAVLIGAGLLALLLNVNVAAYTLEDDNKLLVDMGLSTLFVVGMLQAAFLATATLSREIETRTVLAVVSKPVPRWALVVGKYLGVAAAIGLAYWLQAITFLITVRHRVQSSVRIADTYDGPVLAFGLLAIVIALVVSAAANYLYRRPFPSTFSVVAAVAATVAWGLISCVSRSWRLQHPATDLNPQLVIGLAMVLLAVLVLAAVAVAASTRLGRLPTLMIASGTFLLGLVGEYLVAATGSTLAAPLAAIVPNLQLFWPADALTQGHAIPVWHLGWVAAYALALVTAALSLAVLLFQSRDVG